ncbi:MAG: hypothetical protein M1827_007328 [Pycnora praestabilis]|nr:MAG: hypothetical protein M1827_007328 [Pycnora praestabilis]
MPDPERKPEGAPKKLRRLPKHARIRKRPILHPPIASPYAGSQLQKVVYISTSTPFMSAVKRVRKLLTHIDKRSMGPDLIDLLPNNHKNRGRTDKQTIARTGKKEKGEPEEVVMKATGKAIEKALGLALFFQGQEDCKVTIRTGSVGVIDDIVEGQKEKEGERKGGGEEGSKRKRSKTARDDGKADGDATAERTNPEAGAEPQHDEVMAEEVEEELPESRMRMTSMIEVAVSLR